MKLLHTSDWHLGKKLFKLDRSSEHEKYLEWLIETLKTESIDALLIAGDIFDTPTPPHQSLQLFYNFLHRVSTETQTDTYIIAGNHDSGILLEAPSQILHHHRVKVWGRLSTNPEDHWITVTKGTESIELCSIPFFRSYELLPQGEGDAISALEKYLKKEKSSPHLLMLHHLAGIFEASGSEQVVSLSGVDSIPADLLKEFDYVALGHIHKPQKISSNAYYSGSPIPLRFSETAPKSVVLIHCEDKVLTHKVVPIPKFRDLFTIKVNETNWKEKIFELSSSSDLPPIAEIQIKLSSPKVGLIDEIKKCLEEKGIELLSYLPTYSGEAAQAPKNQHLFELSHLEIFEEFYAMRFPDSPEVPSDLKDDFASLLERVNHAAITAKD